MADYAKEYPRRVVLVNPSDGTDYAASGGGGGGGDASAANQVLQIAQETAINTVLGTVTASPTANTIAARLKDLLTGIVLAAGSNVIGAVTQSGNWVLSAGSALIGKVGIDQTTDGTTNAVSLTKGTVASTTMQNAVSATGNGTSLDVQGKAVAVLQITGTFSATINFEASVDDTNWFNINATQLGADALITSATGTGLFRISCAGIKSIRARVTWTSGTSVTVVGYSTIVDSHAKVVTIASGSGLNVDPTISVSTAYEASRQAVATSGRLLSIEGYNSKTSTQFIQVHDVNSTPADTAVPKAIFSVPASSNFVYTPNDTVGDLYSTGIYVCNSSTGPTKTIGSADCWFRVRYR